MAQELPLLLDIVFANTYVFTEKSICFLLLGIGSQDSQMTATISQEVGSRGLTRGLTHSLTIESDFCSFSQKIIVQ